MIRNVVIFFLLVSGSINAFSQSAESDWFKTGPDNTYTLRGNDIHPAALFQKLSFYSGVEIRYEKSLHKGLQLDITNGTLEELFRYVDSSFSTLKAYAKNQQGENVLTALSILPKGQFQSSELVLAYDPVKEAIAHKQNETPSTSQKVYVTRMEKLEIKVREQLNNLAEAQIKQRNRQAEKVKERKTQKKEEKEKIVSDLRKLKKEDPEIYQRKLEIFAWRYPDLEKAVNADNAISQAD